MNVLSIDGISKSFNERILFENVSFGIDQGQKIALLGVNGCGKSTLLKIAGGLESTDSGDVSVNKNIRVSFLTQMPNLDENANIITEVFNSEHPQASAVKAYQTFLVKAEKDPSVQEDLQAAMEQVDNLGAWDFEDKARQVLGKLNIHDSTQLIKNLSGGQKKRVALAKVLLEEPDLLILDEPTNHLDLDAIEWLENYLAAQNLTILMVTHDRYFLDRVTNHIMEIDRGQVYRYYGNYAYFLEKKADREEREMIEVEKAKNLMKKELDWIRRQPKARGTKAKYRIDAFHDLKAKASTNLKKDELEIKTGTARMGKKIIEIENLKFSFGEQSMVNDFSYVFKKKDRIGIVGKNGAGKSTFLNLLTGGLDGYQGKITLGQNTRFGYYSQSELEHTNDQKVIDVIKEIAEVITLDDGSTISAAQLLNLFLFDPKAQYNYVYKLSGGEKRRLQLLKVLMYNPNFLILDEPTNDLDIMTLNILEDYLEKFGGCLIIVSHDRYFMDRLVDQLFVFRGEGEINIFNGNYTDFREEEKNVVPVSAPTKTEKDKTEKQKSPKEAKLTFNEKREFETLEKEIEKLENQKAEFIEKLNAGTGNHEELTEWSQEIEKLTESIEEKEMRWLELSERA
ncbi:MAG: ABC-F family ATP-binding cassette domain-containing protein [bacterium]|nr:ABC-F family ATP-binding cassette domain-containing protein [bacterium]